MLTRFERFIVGFMEVADGFCNIFTFGGYSPQLAYEWTLKYLRKARAEGRREA